MRTLLTFAIHGVFVSLFGGQSEEANLALLGPLPKSAMQTELRDRWFGSQNVLAGIAVRGWGIKRNLRKGQEFHSKTFTVFDPG